MKLKKFLLVFICIITLFSLFTVNTNNNNIKAATAGYKYIPTSDGSFAKYLGTETYVEVKEQYEKPVTEFRGVWVTPLSGDIKELNYGKKSTMTQLTSVLDNMEKHNLNTIIFHIRTHNDALYDTKLAPKSPYVSAMDFSDWDYLKWFIDECHNRGIEFHAWMNPYRLVMGRTTTVSQITEKYKDYFLNPASKAENILIGQKGAILDPGSPEVRDYLVDTCMEVIKKYDVDAIHFDDYFYMRGVNDSKTFRKYKDQFNTDSISEFRRLQIDEFIKDLSKEMYDYNIKNHKAVQLGISPSGCYQNSDYSYNPTTVQYKYDANGTLISPIGSNTRGYAHYDDPLYSDVKKWVDNEWIDYVMPQLYGSFENIGARYADLIEWWSHVCKNKKVNFIPGIGIYQIQDDSDKGWYTKNLKTFESSLLYNQKYKEVKGFCLYSYEIVRDLASTHKDLKYVFDYMLDTKALNPKSQRYDLKVANPSFNIYQGKDSFTIKVDKKNEATKYAIYKAEGDIDINNPSSLIKVIDGKDIITFTDKESNKNINYGIRTINQANQLSDLKVINASKALSKIDFPLAKLNPLLIQGSVDEDVNIQILVERATLYAGINATYKVYSSLDKENWELVREYENPTIEILRSNHKFNNYLHPEYIKYTVENDYGIIESDIYTLNYEHLSPDLILEYMVDKINKQIEGMFK